MEVYTTDCNCSAAEPASLLADSLALKFSLFPNPAKNFIIYKLLPVNQTGSFKIKLTSVNGAVLKSYSTTATSDTIDITSLPPQVYIFTISHGSKRTSLKFVK
jgi:Secretion system C-terminal sorting domain